MCEIKLYSIDNSKPAVKFEVVEKPNNWIGEVKKNEALSEIGQQRYDYWVAFQEYAFKDDIFAEKFNKRKASQDHWINFAVGSSGCHIAVSQIRKRNELNVELYIDEDKEFYRSLFKHKEEIEKNIDLAFDWQELPEKKASRIIVGKSVVFDKKEEWEEQFKWIMEVMIKIKNEFRKYF